MECAKQGYWSWEYHESKQNYCDTRANHNYERFAKRQYHKVRRRYDRKVIDNQLWEADTPYYDRKCCDWSYLPDFPYIDHPEIKQHNNKQKIAEMTDI